MIDKQKEYWFAFEPYIYITRKQKSALIYNTLDGNHLVVIDKDVLLLLDKLSEKNNCGVIKITPKQWTNPNIAYLLEKSRELFFGDLYECELSKGKPIQLYPLLNLQGDIKRLQQLNPNHIGTKMFTYLYQLTIELGELKYTQIDFFLENIWKQIRYSQIKRIHVFPQNYQQVYSAYSWLKQESSLFECVIWYLTPSLALEVIDSLKVPVCVIMNDVKAGFPNINANSVKWNFKIHSEDELSVVSKWIEQNPAADYKIECVYNRQNIDFFKKNVYLNKEDLFTNPISLQSIMRNQVLNTNDFGKFYITADGNVYGNKLFPSIGNINSESIRDLVQKEMTEGNSWLRIRNQAPCNECIYQWLCPSPTDYELTMGIANLCHIN